MQQLQFEASWDKALAAEDRQTIEKIFNETKDINRVNILFSPLREAINHKGELLVTVLVHNFTDHQLDFTNTKLVYSIHGEVIAENIFTLRALSIPAFTSMPWTFIFPEGSYKPLTSFENGRIEIG